MKKKLMFFVAAATLLWNCTDHNVQTSNYELDASKSVAEWKGYLKTGYFNQGSIAVKSENLFVQDGRITGGSFTIPLSSILNFNLPTQEVKEQLVHHLQSPDFFNMALHPDLKFEIKDVTAYSGSVEGTIAGANYQVNGMLTMLGKANLVSFPVKINFTGESFTVEGKVKIDRTKWGITYASDPALPAENFIEPMIDIHLKLAGNKK